MPKVTICFGGQCKITIPKELAQLKKWNKKGTVLRFVERDDGRVYIQKVK